MTTLPDNFLKRIGTASILIVFLGVCFWIAPKSLWAGLLVLLCFASLFEYFKLCDFQRNSYKILYWSLSLFFLLVWLADILGIVDYALNLIFLSLIFWFFSPLLLLSYHPGKRWCLGLSAALLGPVVIVLGCFSAWVILDIWGRYYLLFGICGIVCIDSFAYFLGQAFGQTKLVPLISPGKSFEGLVGAITGATLLFCTAGYVPFWHHIYFLKKMTMSSYPIVISLFVLFAVLGDLLESAVKRTSGVKDSGLIFPGHGGFLDRLDAYFSVMPFYFFMLITTTH